MPSVIIRDQTGTDHRCEVSAGASLLEIVRGHGLEMEGRCEGSLACCTCHVIVDPAWFELLPPPSEDEQDMLDTVASGLTVTSRLGCQIRISDKLDGLTLRLPGTTSTA